MRTALDEDVLARITRLARSHRAPLAALARAEGATPEDAVDCVQEAFCTLLDMTGRGEVARDDEGWRAVLSTIVRNAARNRRRRHFRKLPHVEVDAQTQRDDAPGADEALARAEARVRLQMCVAALCEVQQAVVTLRVLEEQPGDDVARALGISAGHVAVLLHRAKRSLRACMEDAPCR